MTNKGISIDIWRFAASFLVVAIHISPFENIDGEFDFFLTAVLGRTAVPLFLMITGYYTLHKASENKKKPYILHGEDTKALSLLYFILSSHKFLYGNQRVRSGKSVKFLFVRFKGHIY